MNDSKKPQVIIIPEPIEVTEYEGSFKITSSTSLHATKELKAVSLYLQELFYPSLGWKIPITAKTSDDSGIQLVIKSDFQEIGEEGYIFKSTEKGISIEAKTPNGIFYGIQTLRQLLPKEIESQKTISKKKWLVPSVTIKDFPRFKWRGFMLDEARHFMGIEVVKKLLDLMALHKLNKFHWHLVDDQGWRVEIKKYPKLIEIGAFREVKKKRGEKSSLDKPGLYGGFHTREEIKEIVAYAKERFIDIIPEIEMPGHCTASLAAYPELSCTGGPFTVPTRWGIFADVYCPGKNKVYEFLEDVLSEIIEIFPYEVIHIGGDEVPKKRWRKCSDCKKKMEELGLEDVKKLQVHLTNHFQKHLESKGKRLMGWNQILDPELSAQAICQFWLGSRNKVIEHMKKGGEIIGSNYLSTYLDHPYKIISLNKAYNYEPRFARKKDNLGEQIIGIEPPLWTERVSNEKRLYRQAFPRLTAYAETAWTPKKLKNYEKFKTKLAIFLKRLDVLGINYASLKEAD
ncbi:MAG: beta-N-acetylhexosaminidase [Asgard group archaeon]|nr:beta-N-acetylhexosaminidase [Asgard group archaeon]